MAELYLLVAIAEIAVGGILVVRLARGPSAFADRDIYLDVALWLASFSYLGTLVWARLLERELL
jgi:multicomponent Na+:H+ antiporter subunit F